jgi:hypothetical protein
MRTSPSPSCGAASGVALPTTIAKSPPIVPNPAKSSLIVVNRACRFLGIGCGKRILVHVSSESHARQRTVAPLCLPWQATRPPRSHVAAAGGGRTHGPPPPRVGKFVLIRANLPRRPSRPAREDFRSSRLNIWFLFPPIRENSRHSRQSSPFGFRPSNLIIILNADRNGKMALLPDPGGEEGGLGARLKAKG